MRALQAVLPADVVEIFRHVMATNLGEVAQVREDGSVFILTGDIPAMWLRDSAAQLRPYVMLCGDDPDLQDVLVGVLRRQLLFLLTDPYGRVTAMNRALEALTGWTETEARGRPYAEVLPLATDRADGPSPIMMSSTRSSIAG